MTIMKGINCLHNIQQVVELYFMATYHGDVQGIRQAFHPKSQITGHFKEQYIEWDLEQFIAHINSKPSAAVAIEVYDKKIISIDLTRNAAMVKAQVLVGGIFFTDYITLLKLDGAWIIRNKSFDAR